MFLILFISFLLIIRNNKTKSPFYSSIPEEIGVAKNQYTNSTSTVLLQNIPTKGLKARTLEGGLPGGMLAWLIVGALIGSTIAPVFKQEALLGAAVGLIFLPLVGSKLFQADNIQMIIDNATNHDVKVSIDSLKPIQLPKLTHVRVTFKEGLRPIRVVNKEDNIEIEGFLLDAKEFGNNSDKDISEYYIYNIAEKNSYTANHVIYTPTK